MTWFYYAVFARGRDINRGVTRWCRIIIIIFWLGVALSFVGTSMADFSDVELDTAGTEQLFAAKQIYEKAIDGWGTLIDNVTHAVGAVEDTVSIRIKQASGEYYYGVVEQNENEQLGVYLEDLKPSQSLYEEYGSVTVFASLMARTLDDAVNVDVACFAGRETAPTPGKVYPSDSFDVYNLQKEELDCSFERLPVGTNEVTFTADFNFETIGYLKRYFADYDAVVAATRQDVDLLDEYQILDKNPVAHYTNGPVAIGMGPESSLIGISETRTVKPRLALTLDSKWDGQIKEISEVVLIMPKELSLDSSTCTDPDWTAYNVEDCVDSEIEHKTTIYQECEGDEGCVEEVCTAQLENYNAYKLSLAGKPAYKNVEEYITISCRLNVDDVAGLLGATPIATHYFYVKTRYDYQISEDTSVTVEAEEKITMPGEEVKESEDVPSFTSSQKQEALQYIFNKYKDYMFAANKTFGTPVCMQAGIIAQISKGDPNYYDINGERKGLMGITDKMANEAAADAGVGSSYYLYDAETNIMLGNAYLKQIADGTGSNFGDEVIKYYYSGAYLQTDDPTADNEDIIGFVNRVNTYIEECESLGLGEEDILVKEEEVNTEDALVEGLFTYTQSQGELAQYLYTLGGKAVMLRFEPFFTNDDFFDIYFQYGSEDVDNIGVSYIDQFNYWYSFSNYGLFQVFYDVKNTTLKYRYYNDFVKNLYLEEDKPEDVFGDGVLFVEYTGSEVVVSLARDPKDPENLGEICDVGWYEFITYITCEETLTDTDDLSGLIIRNIKTKQSAYSVGVGEEYAYVQLDWSNERQLEGVTS
ncbi:hypothetical protein COV16_07355 [Candidatus Woesearchaeota archaeon CG10_big_fil_rev_8_21_14_0_10_34_8]|nr:MAG: hypothetical protein COV16_07355 [Candidatus Woesearchaeota archaeon CG10_big_fil_rev_8_21_14_0_10_34_8]